MAADAFSSFLGMTLQATGNNNNAWGTILNGSALLPLERAIAGNISHAVTGGTLDLSGSAPPAGTTQVLDFIQIFTGALTAKQIVLVPNISKGWYIFNGTTGSFPLHIQTPDGNPTQIPQGAGRFVVCDGNNDILRADRDDVGHFEYAAVLDPGNLSCDGSSLLRTDYPDLFGKVGTTFGSVDALHFTLPLLTDTGRFLRSTTSALTVGTYQANQNQAHTHGGASFSGTTSATSNDHTHSGSGTTGLESQGHSHSTGPTGGVNIFATAQGGGASVMQPGGSGTGGESASHTHSYSFTTGGQTSNHTHTYTGTTGTIPSSGGSEARPEALAVIVSIRY